MTTLLTVCCRSFFGTARALRNFAALLPGSRSVEIGAAGPEVEFLRSWLRERPPALLLLGAWSRAYEPLLRDGHRVAVYWSSSPIQSELSGETVSLGILLNDPRILRIYFSSDEMARAFSGLHLPTLVEERSAEAEPLPSGEHPRLSLFSSPSNRARKNVFATLLGVAQLGPKATLVVNGLTQDPAYAPFLPSRVEERGWLAEGDYFAAIGSVQLGLQLTLSDSWNLVAAHHLQVGVPVLGSPMLPVLQALPTSLRKPMTVSEVDSPSVIASRIEHLLADPAGLRELGLEAAAALKRIAKKQRRRVKAELEAACR